MESCEHISEIRVVVPRSDGCEDCLKIGAGWLHLRLCKICGHVGCCDQSPNRHATKHFEAVGHPIIKSFGPGRRLGILLSRRYVYESLPQSRV
ncbi:MAG: UBP-type zinc finger domain-containing protein [Pyrinomonadaceae bacterium]